jgi:hypothetical protein
MSLPMPLSGPFCDMKRPYEVLLVLIAFWNSPTFIAPLSIRARILRLGEHVSGRCILEGKFQDAGDGILQMGSKGWIGGREY